MREVAGDGWPLCGSEEQAFFLSRVAGQQADDLFEGQEVSGRFRSVDVLDSRKQVFF